MNGITSASFTSSQMNEMYAQGWGIVDSRGSDDGDWQIQKLDDANVFETDSAAIEFVYRRAVNGDIIARKALAFIALNNPMELRHIIKK